jgi:hypothetical protein
MKDEHNDTLARIGKHFAQKGLLIFGVWMVKRVLWKQGNNNPQQGKVKPGQGKKPQPPFKLYWNPQREFRPVNPA